MARRPRPLPLCGAWGGPSSPRTTAAGCEGPGPRHRRERAELGWQMATVRDLSMVTACGLATPGRPGASCAARPRGPLGPTAPSAGRGRGSGVCVQRQGPLLPGRSPGHAGARLGLKPRPREAGRTPRAPQNDIQVPSAASQTGWTGTATAERWGLPAPGRPIPASPTAPHSPLPCCLGWNPIKRP